MATLAIGLIAYYMISNRKFRPVYMALQNTVHIVSYKVFTNLPFCQKY